MRYTYTFDQLRDTSDNIRDRLFRDYDSTIRQFGAIDPELYFTADNGVVEAPDEASACERLFLIYNSDKRPEGYTGRSMSVSDIINLWDNDTNPPTKTAYFCDSIGFKKLEENALKKYGNNAAELEARKKIEDFAANQHYDVPLCPRCGRETIKERLHTNAWSRYADVYICDTCGTDEAIRDLNGEPMPLTAWAIVSQPPEVG